MKCGYYIPRWYFKIKFKRKHFLSCISFIAFLFFFYKSTTIKRLEKLFIISRENHIGGIQAIVKEPKSNVRLRYILQWTKPNAIPFRFMGVGQQGFIERKCPHVNCYVTSNKSLLENITMFDVIAFDGRYIPETLRPKIRSPHQKYVFVSLESSAYYPVCDPKLDGYFNWTWTYRLDSDIPLGYFVVRDLNGTIIGPNKVMHWMKQEDMLPVPDYFQLELGKKTKLAAWFVSNCQTQSGRKQYIQNLRKVLKQYKQEVDIYGKCGRFFCSPENVMCNKMISDDYYFYMAFENSFGEDYVTEKVLHGLQYNAVPIVYGSANYSRFLPPGSYINALNFSPNALADKMLDLFMNFNEYVEYFRWKNHYTIHSKFSNVTTNDYCAVCALVSDDSKFKQHTVYNKFRTWWNPLYNDSLKVAGNFYHGRRSPFGCNIFVL